MADVRLAVFLCMIGLSAGFRISLPNITIPEIPLPSWEDFTSLIPKTGSCPDISVEQNFAMSRYAGVWYGLIAMNPSPIEMGMKCMASNYTVEADGTIDILNTVTIVGTSVRRTMEGTATADASNPAKMTITSGPEYLPLSKPYWVVSTDYTSYSLVYSCKQTSFLGRDLFYIESARILTRQRGSLDASKVNELKEILQDNGITGFFREIDQSRCNEDNTSLWPFRRVFLN